MTSRHDILRGSRDKKRKRRMIRLWSFLFTIIFFIFVIIFSLRAERFLISDIKIEGNTTLKEEVLIKEAEKILDGNYYFIFPKNNFLFYPKSDLKVSIETAFPKVEYATVELNSMQSITINIKEREPAFVWCVLEDVCRFLDKKGIIFSDDVGISKDVFLKIDASDKTVDLGEQALAEEEVFVLSSLMKVLPEVLNASVLSGSNPIDIKILPEGDYQIHLKEKDKDNHWSLLINFRGDLSKLLDNLVSVITSDVFKEESTDVGNLDYIDLRFGRKVFYKFK